MRIASRRRPCAIRISARAIAPPTASEMYPASCKWAIDRKSTRLNSSHANISYAVFCLKKKKNKNHYPDYIQISLFNLTSLYPKKYDLKLPLLFIELYNSPNNHLSIF